MGMNISGLIFNTKLSEKEIESLVKSKIEYLKEVDFDTASSPDRDENLVDVIQSDVGTLIITGMGEIYDPTDITGETIQFICSDASDTYYFEYYSKGEFLRKLITSQGSIEEDFGVGMLTIDDDFFDKISYFIEEYLQGCFPEEMYSGNFKRYELKV